MTDQTGITGETLLEARFDPNVARYLRWVGSFWLVVSVVGIVLIPFWLLFSMWYCPEFLRRASARLTTRAVEAKKGVFFRSEATIPLDRITDVRLHDDPIMRMCGLRGLKVETAGQSSETGIEGSLIGVVSAEDFRNAVLIQRQRVLDAESSPDDSAPSGDRVVELLTEIRDILKSKS